MYQKTMLYIAGLAHNIWGILVDTIEVDAHELEDYLAQGWYVHPFEVRDALEQARGAALAAPGPGSDKTESADDLEMLRLKNEEAGRLLKDAEEQLALVTQERTELAALLEAARKASPAAPASDASSDEPPAQPTAEEIELELRIKLAEEAKTKGVKIDGRWNSTKIQAALDKAASGA